MSSLVVPANARNLRDLGSIPRLGRSPGGGHSNRLQYSCPGETHGQTSLAGYSPWGRKESDMTEETRHTRRAAKFSEEKFVELFQLIKRRNGRLSCTHLQTLTGLYNTISTSHTWLLST